MAGNENWIKQLSAIHTDEGKEALKQEKKRLKLLKKLGKAELKAKASREKALASQNPQFRGVTPLQIGSGNVGGAHFHAVSD